MRQRGPRRLLSSRDAVTSAPTKSRRRQDQADTRVLVCEWDVLARAGIRTILTAEAGIEISGETASMRQAVSMALRSASHVVLTGSLTAAAQIASAVREPAAGVRAGVLALITPAEEDRVLDAIRVGVRGVVYRDAQPAELIAAIRAVADGHAWFVPPVTALLLDWLEGGVQIPAGAPLAVGTLSDSQLRVLGFLAMGMTGTEIARRLGVTEATVRSHVHHMLTRLGLRNRAQAVAFAYQHGLIGQGPGGAL
jgi:DNA-binding NarL/FixJ family response regulator